MTDASTSPEPEDRNEEAHIDELPAAGDFEREPPRPARRLVLTDVPIEFAVPEWDHLSEMYRQRRHEAKVVFSVAIPLLIAGAVVILVGTVGGIVRGLLTGSVVKGLATGGPTGVYGAVMDFLGFFMLRFYRQVNAGIDSIVHEINASARERRLFWMAYQMADQKNRDAAIGNLIKDLTKKRQGNA